MKTIKKKIDITKMSDQLNEIKITNINGGSGWAGIFEQFFGVFWRMEGNTEDQQLNDLYPYGTGGRYDFQIDGWS